ncbi:MAG: hypothetical protein SGI73_12185 [Chloroflexota bacterium]|nr:hypothetical protein [Chloroflexota bacterium]
MDEGALAWLENLASEQEDSLFNLDLSDVPGDSGADNSMAWLENLAASAPAESAPVPSRGGSSDNDDPFASGGNPIAWLEQLAREQGAKSEEMTTPASPHDDYSRDIAAPDFSNLGAELELLPPQDPSDFLQSLASSQGYDEIGVSAVRPPAMPEPITYDLDIDQAIASGTASRDQMQQWLELQTDKLMESEEIDLLPEDTFDLLAEEDADAPAIPAELPSWLVESFGMPPTAPAAAQPNRPSLESLFPADDPAELSEMPEWLKAESGASAVMDLDSIFADDEPTMPYVEIDIVPLSSPSIQVPTNQAKPGGDRWAEAFDDEYSQGAVDINNVPDWYQRNLNDAERVAAVERMVTSESLPDEDRLAAGQPQSVPDWLAESVVAPPAPPFEAAPVAEEPTDWMKDLETTISPDDIPAWLLETIDEQPSVDDTIDLFDIDLEPEPPAPEPVRQTPPPVRAAPPPRAPEPVRAPVSRAGLSLGEARRLSQSGALADGLAHYEGMIRAQVELDDVVDDLSSLSRQHRDNPTIFRVLGDGLMRQGKLQAALDTYRQALNQL